MVVANRRQVLARERKAGGLVLAFKRQLPAFRRLDRVGGAEHLEIGDRTQCRNMLDRLVGRAVFAKADRIVGQHMDDADAHQSRKADRRARIVGKHEERAAVRDKAAMQRDAVHGRSHAVLANAVMQIAAGEVVWRDRLSLAGLRVVRTGQVGRSTECFRQGTVDHFQHHFGCLAGRDLRLVGDELLLVGLDRRFERARQFTAETALEGGADLGVFSGKTIFPCLALLVGTQTGEAPGIEDFGRNDEGLVTPAKLRAGQRDLVCAERRTVRLGAAGLVGRAVPDRRLAGDEGRALALLRLFDGAADRFGIMTVDGKRVPAGRSEAFDLIGGVGNADRAVDRDAVVIPKHDQLVQLEVTGKRNGFLADAFHEAAIADQRIGVVILKV
jgi:hypothetical protein